VRGDIRLADLCTEAAREAGVACALKGLHLVFDYRGCDAVGAGEPAALRAALRRVFHAAAEILQEGLVLFTARCDRRTAGGVVFTAVAGASGRFVAAAQWTEVLGRLQLQGVEPMNETSAATPVAPARGTCPHTGGTVRFAIDPAEGTMFSLQLELPAATAVIEDAADARGARAWVVAELAAGDDGTERRLQRLGWAVRRFASIEEAAREAESMSPAYRRPALVLAYESPLITLERLRWLWALLPPTTEVVLAVEPQSPSLAVRGDSNVTVRHRLFSPADLERFTRRAADGEAPSGLTQPAPLAFEQRRRALVVDDNEVNQMVASGMLQVLGFEVETAFDGDEAIARCVQSPPDLVLMDLHMPGMDGLEATRRLRLLQREGALPRFLILAATADVSSQEACQQAGMDAHLPKPLNLAGLESQLRRLIPAMP